MIRVNQQILLNESEIEFDFILASGPGGQNVNKVSSAVQLRFRLAESQSIPDAIKNRLNKLAKKQISKEGVLILSSRKYRSQERNRKKVLEKLVDLIQYASKKPKKRRPTKPSAASIERRLKEKRKQGQIKQQRQPIRKECLEE